MNFFIITVSTQRKELILLWKILLVQVQMDSSDILSIQTETFKGNLQSIRDSEFKEGISCIFLSQLFCQLKMQFVLQKEKFLIISLKVTIYKIRRFSLRSQIWKVPKDLNFTYRICNLEITIKWKILKLNSVIWVLSEHLSIFMKKMIHNILLNCTYLYLTVFYSLKIVTLKNISNNLYFKENDFFFL